MGISYKPLWLLLVKRDMKKKDLMKQANLSPTIVARMVKNIPIGGGILDRICTALHCQPGDVM